jgi:hypothetical protein
MYIKVIKRKLSQIFILGLVVFNFCNLATISAQVIETNRYGTYNTGATVYNNSPAIYRSQASTYGSVPQIVCPLNYTLKSNSCIPNKKTCKNGMIVSFYEECLKTCWGGMLDGQQINEDLTCPLNPSQYQTYGTGVTSAGCVNRSQISSTGRCEKVCPNGAVINETDVCPSQTKICNNGKVVAYNSVCTRICDNGSEVSESATCIINADVNIVTGIASGIDLSKARLTGIVLMPVSTTGSVYFEYSNSLSMSPLLTTNKATINNNSKYNIANTIEGLESNSKYYYRLVLEVAGRTYKCEIASFITLANDELVNKVVKSYSAPRVADVYNKEVVKVKVAEASEALGVKSNKKDGTKEVVTKKENIVKENSGTNNSMLGLSLVRASDKVEAGNEVKYRVAYIAKGEADVNNLVLTLKTPKGMKYISSTIGNYDEFERELIIKSEELLAGDRGQAEVVYMIESGVLVGTNIILTAKADYEYTEDKKVIRDDTSSYIINTVSKSIDLSAGDNGGLFSNMLFKILFIILLALILFVLGKKLYNERSIVMLRNKILKNKSKEAGHH